MRTMTIKPSILKVNVNEKAVGMSECNVLTIETTGIN